MRQRQVVSVDRAEQFDAVRNPPVHRGETLIKGLQEAGDMIRNLDAAEDQIKELSHHLDMVVRQRDDLQRVASDQKIEITRFAAINGEINRENVTLRQERDRYLRAATMAMEQLRLAHAQSTTTSTFLGDALAAARDHVNASPLDPVDQERLEDMIKGIEALSRRGDGDAA